MNPSIVNNRARTVQGSDGKAQPTTSSRMHMGAGAPHPLITIDGLGTQTLQGPRDRVVFRFRDQTVSTADTRPGSPVVPQTSKGELRLLEKSVGRESQLNSAKW